jgi:uncharacterized protein YebE (UPF0316 family)
MSVIRPLLIAGLVVTEVGLWQWRMVIAARGSRPSAMVLGTAGALLQITAISQVVTNVDDPFSIAAYAVGVGLGVLLGLIAGDRLTPGTVGVTVVTRASGVAAGLWARGWAATAQTAHAETGPVTVLFVPVNRRHEERLHRDVAELAPGAIWSTELRTAPPAPPPSLRTAIEIYEESRT